jgi:hypothetical protein
LRSPALPASATRSHCTAAACSPALAHGISRSRSSPARSPRRSRPAIRFLAKPAEQTPLTALRALELLQAAGVPADAAIGVFGDGESIGAPLVADPGLRASRSPARSTPRARSSARSQRAPARSCRSSRKPAG